MQKREGLVYLCSVCVCVCVCVHAPAHVLCVLGTAKLFMGVTANHVTANIGVGVHVTTVNNYFKLLHLS